MKLTKEQIDGLQNCMNFGPGFVAECRGVGEIDKRSGMKEGKAWEMIACKLQLETGDGAHVKVMEVEVQAERGETEGNFRRSMGGIQRGSLVYVGLRPSIDEKRNQVFRVTFCVALLGAA